MSLRLWNEKTQLKTHMCRTTRRSAHTHMQAQTVSQSTQSKSIKHYFSHCSFFLHHRYCTFRRFQSIHIFLPLDECKLSSHYCLSLQGCSQTTGKKQCGFPSHRCRRSLFVIQLHFNNKQLVSDLQATLSVWFFFVPRQWQVAHNLQADTLQG